MANLDLHAVVTAPDGTSTRWGPEDLNPGTIPQGISFRTQRMGGFADASLSLSRRIDGENTDVRLLNRIELVGADGATAYDGYVQSLPRTLNTDHVLGVQAAGWAGHAQDTPFTEIFVDRDLARWTNAPATARKIGLITANTPHQADASTGFGATAGAAVTTGIPGPWATPILPRVEAWYDAGPTSLIGRIYYEWSRSSAVNNGDTNWRWEVVSATGDNITNDSTGNLRAAGPAGGTFTPSAARRYALLLQAYEATNTGVAGTQYELYWVNLAVYGNHGLPLIGTTQPYGVAASDVIKYIAGKYAPLLRTTSTSITQTTYPIPHLTFLTDTSAWDAMLACNAFHLWNLAVWENRTLHYTPPDFTDYDWEIRTDDPGTTIDLQGSSADDLVNGVRVQFTNVATGQTEILDPTAYADLRDDRVENDATRAGRRFTKGYEISYPTTRDAALQIGRAALAEFNAPKQPGSVSKQFTVRDRAGHDQPVWKVRAGDRVVITSSAAFNDRPRMVNETSYDHGNRTLTMGIDSAIPRLEGIAHRQQVALAAAGLT